MLSGLIISLHPQRVLAASATFTVNTEADGSDANPGDGICETANAGECTFRAAIQEANANGNPSDVDNIYFNIPGAGAHQLSPDQGAFPLITQPINIDGSTQGSINCLNHTLLIELNGDNFPSGSRSLFFRAGSARSHLHAISLTGARPLAGVAGAGVKLAEDNITLTCNNIGVKADGVTSAPNALGIVDVANDITIGGPNAADGNLIANMSQYGTHIQFDNLLHPASAPTNILIQNNTYKDNVSAGIEAANAINVRVLNNTVLDNNANGIHINVGTNATVDSNTVFNNGSNGIIVHQAENTVVTNNYVHDNADTGIAVDESLDTDFTNNRLLNNNKNLTISSSDMLTVTNNVLGCDSGTYATAQNLYLFNVTNTPVTGNFVGIDDDGETLLPSLIGVVLQGDLSGTVIGGSTSSERNIITGQQIIGLFLQIASNATMQGNYIGVDGTGTPQTGKGNNTYGVFGLAANNNVIGGINPGEGNIIADNAEGVNVESGAWGTSLNNAILGNQIYASNSGFGIDLTYDSDNNYQPDTDIGINPNDAGDTDTGANYYMNCPEISSITTNNHDVTITYSLDVDQAQDGSNGYRVEFFANQPGSTSGNSEGQYLIGADTVSDSVTNRTITLHDTQLTNGTYDISATTTSLLNSGSGFGSTSEFSQNKSATITITQQSGQSDQGSNSSANKASSGTTKAVSNNSQDTSDQSQAQNEQTSDNESSNSQRDNDHASEQATTDKAAWYNNKSTLLKTGVALAALGLGWFLIAAKRRKDKDEDR